MAQGKYSERLKAEVVKRGWITEAAFQKLIGESEMQHKPPVELLYHAPGVRENELLALLSELSGYSSMKISSLTIEAETLRLVPKQIVEKYRVLPISYCEKVLTIGIVDPTNLMLLDDLRISIGQPIKPVLLIAAELEQGIKQYYDKAESVSAALQGTRESLAEPQNKTAGKRPRKANDGIPELTDEASGSQTIRLVNRLLVQAVQRKASDIFVEPWEKTMRVRYRVDGLLEEALNEPRTLVEEVVSRIKVMSQLNIAEHRIPQDGRFKGRVSGRDVDFRVSIFPTVHGEKVCLRILDSSAQAPDLIQLGFIQSELDIVRRMSARPNGMVLVTGPTGSGKTTTLYSVLHDLDSPGKNITTVEDPVEYQVPGINQVNVREHVGMTFPAALRSILRQDPNVILIGEIRDLITMDIAIKSALTGHLVLSTLHTNDSTSAVVRMINMGVEPFLIVSSVILITAQRLVRRLCTHCREAYKPDGALIKAWNLFPSSGTFYRAKGCEKCRSMGYRGRTLITEIFELKPNVQEMIIRSGSGEEIRRLARENGMRTLRECGIQKVKEGITSAEEIMRVTSSDASSFLGEE